MEWAAYFFAYAFLGWIIDSTYRSVVDRKLTSVSFFPVPFLPIYGFGALMVIWLHQVFGALPMLMAGLAYGIVLAAWELLGGLFCVHVLRVRLWEYTGRWTITSHTSVDRIFAWGFLALVLMHVIHPMVVPLAQSLLSSEFLWR